MIKQITALLILCPLLLWAGWQWQNPTPQGNNLVDVLHTAAGCLAVGAQNTVVHIENSSVELLTTTGLASGTIITGISQSTSEMFICTSTGCIYSSSDGISWSQVYSASGYSFSDICFVDQTGFALGYNEWEECNLLLKTNNNGASWQELSFGSYLDEAYLFTLSFSSPLQGCIGGYGCIVQTTDGGNSWQLQLMNEDIFISDICHATSSLLFAAGEGLDGGELWKSTNGGSSWSSILTTTETLHAITFSSENHGILCGDWGYAAITHNAGASWQEVETPTNALIGSLSTSGNAVIATGSGGLILRSEDGGASYTELSQGTGQGYIRGFAADGSLMAGAGNNNMLITSQNNGVTWQYHTLPWANDPDLINFASVDCFGSTIILSAADYNVGADYLITSTDAGAHWQTTPLSTNGDLVKADFVSSQIGYLASSVSISKTTDGGASFTPLFSHSILLSELAFYNEQHGYTADCSGAILATHDGGTTWSTFNQTYCEPVRQIIPVSPTEAWCITAMACLHTTDGGTSWSTSYEMPPDVWGSLTALEVTAHNEVLLTGSFYSNDILQTTLLISTDGGQSWNEEPTPTANRVYALYSHSTGLFCAADYRGILFYPDDYSSTDPTLKPVHHFASAYPNPAPASGTTLRFTLPSPQHTDVEIFNCKGQRIQRLSGSAETTQSMFWNGRDAQGTAQPSGVYFYRIRSGSMQDVGRIILMK